MPEPRETSNQLRSVFYLLLITLFFLFLLSFIPEFTIDYFHFKKINPLADVRENVSIDSVSTDSVFNKKDSIVKQPSKTIPYRGIEEYGKNNLSYFFKALSYSKKQPVRIAFFGDSFIEGDILCGPFRDTLQQLYGGSGVGYMPITSSVNLFRTTILHEFKNWKTYSIVGNRNDFSPLSLPGYCFRPLPDNEVIYRAPRKKFITAKIFYENNAPFLLKYSLDESVDTVWINEYGKLKQYVFDQTNLNEVKFSFPVIDSIRVYGAAFEATTGISVDNFSMRSNPGMGLLFIDSERMAQFNSYRNYQLIILQYGLNVLSENDSSGYLWYGHKMNLLIEELKKNFPESGILLIGVGDRSSNQDGKMGTMPTLMQLRNVQRATAVKSHIAFWDMFEAMGGENSMVKYTEAIPPLAAKDYTHLTFRGGRKLAKKLADALIQEKNKYEKQ
ncbi:MAG: hypothetical protein OJF59_002548 [Cytophagales bacterium]|jgi:hypothetical protein|nr:hypothetical protein [Bacteroidota bacterium]MBS1980270.1 hypothetical protein [Bacteroidota bacterium]WHZ08794.1 MAG: hypothetical protein OJF59_002548 [Cytophagales bacterium]